MKRWISLLTVILLALTAGCGGISDKEMKKQAEESASKSFGEKPQKPNEKIESGSFYLPENYSISSKKANNAILTKGGQKFLLFINKNERKDSKASYDLLRKEYKKRLVDKTFNADGEFGYLFVRNTKGKEYEAIAGIGGNKLTALIKKEEVPEAAGQMMKVLKSIQ
ncbi:MULTISPECIES: hypothetical protein [Bacillaceae]|uniref:Lipoprotein n=1 Tax=Metabacillus sediminis TaxID=3117746 RepID=A0ABZ2NEW3_9BACI|nr:hypothetical protein [Bacillus sp. SJS]KZZ85706.1 hypothetical protein AS29_003710 [Bacillus sp. SJS]